MEVRGTQRSRACGQHAGVGEIVCCSGQSMIDAASWAVNSGTRMWFHGHDVGWRLLNVFEHFELIAT